MFTQIVYDILTVYCISSAWFFCYCFEYYNDQKKMNFDFLPEAEQGRYVYIHNILHGAAERRGLRVHNVGAVSLMGQILVSFNGCRQFIAPGRQLVEGMPIDMKARLTVMCGMWILYDVHWVAYSNYKFVDAWFDKKFRRQFKITGGVYLCIKYLVPVFKEFIQKMS